MSDEWKALRVIHSKGGVRIVNEYDPTVKIIPRTLNEKTATFETPTYGALFDRCEKVGLPVLGVEFFTYAGHFNGEDIPEWRTFYTSRNNVWGNEEGAQLWSNIGTGAYKEKNGRLWDVGSRISHQLRVCSRRLKELSDSYHSQLCSVVGKQDFATNKRFMNGYTWLCYLSVQSFLMDICILRDYLAEYAANFVFEVSNDSQKSSITTLSGLRKYVLRNLNGEDAIAEELNEITEGDGWLKMLGAYRDLIVHSAPLVQAERRLFAIIKTIEIPGGQLPCISCPMPKNPQEIFVSRANGSMFENFEEQFNRYTGIGEGEADYIDGLEYCHKALGMISDLANKLALRSPVKPQMMVFDSTNIIGEVKVSRA
ncbi:hypothetical protein DFR37_1342 [Eoetvoesiella caeni]|uniref:Uncharacterized protein n=1 Tax=Eoetvoesiella caeni TaxID=645616 RepID=A0A366H0S9_9BURK|nr:hypothetical protein DFR37_1342 [Eoetvoesiella caeni]